MNSVTETPKHDTTTDDAETSPCITLKNALGCARIELDWIARGFHNVAEGSTDPDQVTIYASIAALLAKLAEAEDVADQVCFLAERGQKAYLADDGGEVRPAASRIEDVRASTKAALESVTGARAHIDEWFRRVSTPGEGDDDDRCNIDDYVGASQALYEAATELENIGGALRPLPGYAS